MPRSNPDSAYFREIQRLYEETKTFIGEVKNVSPYLASSASDQLGRAGFLLIEAVASDDEDAFDTNARWAKHQCHFAMAEAAQTGIGGLCQLHTEFDDDYKGVPVVDIVDDYIGIRTLRREIEEELSKDEFHEVEPEEQSRRSRAMFFRLRDGVRRLDDSRIELDKLKSAQTREARRFAFKMLVGAVIGLVSVTVAILRLVGSSAPTNTAP